MLCPECKIHAQGGSVCPACGKAVPERETFGGQGQHYLVVLLLLALGIFAVFILISGLSSGFQAVFVRVFSSRWNWLYILLFIFPVVIGLYTWNALRTEEVTVTDDYIAKHSRWGNQRFAWAQVKSFRRVQLLPRRSRLRKLASIKRLLSREKLVWHLPVLAYELVGYETDEGESPVLRLEPGTIDDLPWLLKLIEEHLGPPVDD